MGFPVPIGSWFRGQFSGIIDEYVLGSRASERAIFNRDFVRELVTRHNRGENHAERLWSLVNFEIWQRRFIDGEDVSSETAFRHQPLTSNRAQQLAIGVG
jgi:asparagine synthase (glutamine-hydrolysing)